MKINCTLLPPPPFTRGGIPGSCAQRQWVSYGGSDLYCVVVKKISVYLERGPLLPSSSSAVCSGEHCIRSKLSPQ